MQFGAFVEIAPGKDGLVHISKLDRKRVEKVEDVVTVGDMIWVKFMEIERRAAGTSPARTPHRDRSPAGRCKAPSSSNSNSQKNQKAAPTGAAFFALAAKSAAWYAGCEKVESVTGRKLAL